MGLGNSDHARFLSIADGKIALRVKEPTTKSVERINKKGTTVHEEFYDHIEGVITDIKVHVHAEFGKFWNVYMVDDTGGQYCLQMNYSGGYSSAFLKMLPNVDFSQKVKISPTMKVVDNKKKVGMFINQDGHAIKHAYTKDNPNGIPQLQKVRFKGVDQWDDTDMMQFLEDMVNKTILPKLRKGQPAVASAPPEPNTLFKGAPPVFEGQGWADDDLPF